MSATPGPVLYEHFLQAAQWHGVPVTLLMAIARVETGFDAAFAAPPPSTARGMFRFTDAMRAQYAAAAKPEATSAEQQIEQAAAMLAQLLSREVWQGNRAGAVMSMYYAKADVGGFAGPTQAGAFRAAQLQHPSDDVDENKKLWPTDARAYYDAVTKARAQFQEGGRVEGRGRLQALALAFLALRDLNGSDYSAQELGFKGSKVRLAADAEVPQPFVTAQLQGDGEPPIEILNQMFDRYQLHFELAPLTDVTTPSPLTLLGVKNPQMRVFPKYMYDYVANASDVLGGVKTWAKQQYKEATQKADEALEQLDKQLAGWGESINNALGYAAAGVVGLVILWVVVNAATSRRS